MTTREKFDKVFSSPYTFSFKNQLCRRDGEWDRIITWEHLGQPGDRSKNDYYNIDDCLDNCLTYIANLESIS